MIVVATNDRRDSEGRNAKRSGGVVNDKGPILRRRGESRRLDQNSSPGAPKVDRRLRRK